MNNLRERVRVNLRETKNAKHANVTIELEGDIEDTDDMNELESLTDRRARQLFEDVSRYAEAEQAVEDQQSPLGDTV